MSRKINMLNLGSPALRLLDGDRGANYPKAHEYLSSGFCLFLSATNVTKTGFEFSEVQFVSEDKDRRLGNGRMARGDIALTTRGTIGNVAFYSPDVSYPRIRINSGMVIIRCDPEFVFPEYLYCVVRSPFFRRQVAALQSGSAQPQLPIRDIKQIKIPTPTIGKQRRIASILSAYDDLIEVNRRRVAILEEMARRLFEEWFVHLRFPGHETVPVHDTPDGPLPEGWTFQPIHELAHVNNRAVRPSTASPIIHYVDISSVSPGRVDKVDTINFEDAPGRARRMVQDGSIIWSTVRPNRRGFAILFDPEPNLIVSTGFAVIDAVGVPASYLYAWTTSDAFVTYLVNNAIGAAYPAVTGATFERAQVLVPPVAIVRDFGNVADCCLRLANQLNGANARLTAARDLLLPRLVSGELSVADAPERFLEAAD